MFTRQIYFKNEWYPLNFYKSHWEGGIQGRLVYTETAAPKQQETSVTEVCFLLVSHAHQRTTRTLFYTFSLRQMMPLPSAKLLFALAGEQ